MSARYTLRQYARSFPALAQQDGPETDVQMKELCMTIMRNALREEVQGVRVRLFSTIQTLAPYANYKGYHEVDRYSSEEMSVLIIVSDT